MIRRRFLCVRSTAWLRTFGAPFAAAVFLLSVSPAVEAATLAFQILLTEVDLEGADTIDGMVPPPAGTAGVLSVELMTAVAALQSVQPGSSAVYETPESYFGPAMAVSLSAEDFRFSFGGTEDSYGVSLDQASGLSLFAGNSDADVFLTATNPTGGAIDFSNLGDLGATLASISTGLLDGTFTLSNMAGGRFAGVFTGGAAQPVPEPSSMALFGIAVAVGFAQIRRARMTRHSKSRV